MFDTDVEMAEANGRWLYERYKESDFDKKKGEVVNPQLTIAWDYGEELKNGKFACKVPKKFINQFIGSKGIRQTLSKDEFKVKNKDLPLPPLPLEGEEI